MIDAVHGFYCPAAKKKQLDSEERLEQIENKSINCQLAWLIRDNPHLVKALHEARCVNGRTFNDLSPDDFKDCP